MIDLGLTADERRAFHLALLRTHRARTSFEILDRDEKVLHTVTDRVMTGQVDISSKSRPDRVLQMEFADADRRFAFVPGGADDATLYADNFVRVERGIYVEAIARWVDIPLFCGPITEVSRDGRSVNVTAVGKESLGLEPATAWSTPGPFGRGVKVVEAIRQIMRAQGERRFDMPNLRATLNRPLSISRKQQPWVVARRLAGDVDRQLFYDGRGRLRLRLEPRRTQWVFRGAPEGDELEGEQREVSLLSRPRLSFDMAEVRNTIEVLGPEPDGKGERPRVVVTAPPGHPLSPWKLARNGEPRFLVETVERGAKDHATLRNVGERILEDRLRAAVRIEFSSVPIYHLEPNDEVAVMIDDERTTFRLQDYTLPLVAGEMTVGYHRRSERLGKRR